MIWYTCAWWNGHQFPDNVRIAGDHSHHSVGWVLRTYSFKSKGTHFQLPLPVSSFPQPWTILILFILYEISLFFFKIPQSTYMGFPDSSVDKESACNAGDPNLIPGLGRSPGEGKGYPLQYSGLENSMDCTVHGAAKRWTWLSSFFSTDVIQHRVLVFLCLAHLTQHNTIWFMLSQKARFPFNGLTLFHCVTRLILSVSARALMNGRSGRPHVLAVACAPVVNAGVQTALWDRGFISLEYVPRPGLPDHVVEYF